MVAESSVVEVTTVQGGLSCNNARLEEKETKTREKMMGRDWKKNKKERKEEREEGPQEEEERPYSLREKANFLSLERESG